ncbi:MAG: hypothetical protein J6V43_01070 [Rikenellaceae bacterium]|nr:hypothetical protein [Rikenellaceae bacterium]
MSHYHKTEPNIGRGCAFCNDCNCEDQDTVTVCEGCFKFHTYDWLADYPDRFPTDIIEVRFKNTRKGYYRNVNNLDLKVGDIVAVEAAPGHDIGIVSMLGEMVLKQMKRTGFSPVGGEFRKLFRKAKPYDIEKWQEAIALEHETMIRSRQIAAAMGLNMKIGDVEYQGDKIKAIFYYIADGRVDFRELIKVFAEQFRIKIEMKQIGARQEAGRIGGLGSCGRELCCASWISSFTSVTTNAARTQDLSLNPQKLAGQCGKLKCCLVYELDSYIDARKSLPKLHEPLHAMDGDYYHISTDVLSRVMSFSTVPDANVGTIKLTAEKVREILNINRAGKKVETIVGEVDVAEPEIAFASGSEEDSITRFDRKKKKNRSKKRGGDRPQTAASDAAKPATENATAEGESNKERQQRRGNNRRGERPQRNNKENNPTADSSTNNGEGAVRENREGGNRQGEKRGRGGRHRNNGGIKPQGEADKGNKGGE